MNKIHLAQQAKKQLTASILGRKASASEPLVTLSAARNAARQSFTGLHPLRQPPDQYRDYIEMLVPKAAADRLGLDNPFFRVHKGMVSADIRIAGRDVRQLLQLQPSVPVRLHAGERALVVRRRASSTAWASPPHWQPRLSPACASCKENPSGCSGQHTPVPAMCQGRNALQPALRARHQRPTILYPAVEEKAARLRFFLSIEHSQAQVESSIQILKELKP